MKRVLWSLLVLVLVLGMSIVVAQDSITLTPYTDAAYGLKSVAPDSWKDIGQGLRVRGKTPTDNTLIGQQSSAFTLDKLLEAILPQLGLTEAPTSVGNYQSTALKWTLYKIESKTPTGMMLVDLAIAKAEAKTYIVLLQTASDEYELLHKQVFLPMLDALIPYTVPVVEMPYQQEEVTFKSGDVTLAGTLTMPLGKGPFAALILVTGSGPQDRDETIGAMKPFQIIADALAREGMAVLRYDDRGVGGSGGDIFATIEETTADASAALMYLTSRSEINHNQMGILGHSEGGIVAAALAANDPRVNFVITIAGPAVTGKAVLLEQGKRILKAEGGTDEMVAVQASFQPAIWEAVEKNDEATYKKLEIESLLAVWKLLPEDQQKELGDQKAYAQKSADQLATEYLNRWYRSLLHSDPSHDWAKTTVPVLALFGGNDVQVPADQNSSALEAALKLAGNKNYKIVMLPNANHLFQESKTGALTEYTSLKPEFTPDFMPMLVDWLKTQVTLRNL